MVWVTKKPIAVRANRWFKNGDHPDDEAELLLDTNGTKFLSEGKVVRRFRNPDVPGEKECKHCKVIMHDHGWIDTLEGGHIVCPGDWIMTGVKGERYPIKDAILRETYTGWESEVAESAAEAALLGWTYFTGPDGSLYGQIGSRLPHPGEGEKL